MADVGREVWQADGLPQGLVIRVLNTGDEGARTLIVDVTPGWRHQVSHWHTCDEEFLVLGGELQIGDTTYRKGHYVFRPAGLEHGPTSCRIGCQLLYWHDSTFDVRTDPPPDRASISKPFIDGIDTAVPLEKWESLQNIFSHRVDISAEIRMLRLRRFEETGCDCTLVYIPHMEHAWRHLHPADEEVFFLPGLAPPSGGDGELEQGWGCTDPMHVNVGGGYYYNLKGGTIHGPAQAWNVTALEKHYGKHDAFDHIPIDVQLAPEAWSGTLGGI
jgi:hypothetical protein